MEYTCSGLIMFTASTVEDACLNTPLILDWKVGNNLEMFTFRTPGSTTLVSTCYY
jgi:hypothetical protein